MNEFAELPVRQFLSDLASSAPTPGGGTAAAVAGAMGAALAEMVGALLSGKFAPVRRDALDLEAARSA